MIPNWKIFAFLLPLVLGTFTLSAQSFEVKPKTFETEGKKEPLLLPKKDPNPLPNYLQKEFLKNTADQKDKNKHFDQPEIDINPQETFVDPADYYLERLKNPENEKNPGDFKVDQYLGDFKSNAPFVQVIFRDHEAADGDRVRILLNDRVVETNVLLLERFKRLNVELISGFNKIEFIALNQGDSGPNTAEVRVYEDNGKLVMANQWNLATGSRATVIVVKE